jgi:hypothetical protein
MIRTTGLIGLTTALCLSFAAPAAYANYDQHDAKRDCERKISHDRRYKGLQNVKVDDRGNHNFRITGKVRMDGKDADFNCRIRHREVVSWNIEDDGDGDGNTAVAVGAGVLAVAAIAALAAGSDDHDDDHSRSRNDYQSGDDNAFDDMRYLKRECRREILRHLREDHGKVRQLKMSDVHLRNRELRGDGRVSFDRGGDHDLSFSCDFDRRGRVHDGHYHYTRDNETDYSDVPEITARPSGEFEVSMPSGCTALYSRQGDLITRGRSCSSRERRKANDAARRYLREQ